jgi:preprotein translocase subunit SecD
MFKKFSVLVLAGLITGTLTGCDLLSILTPQEVTVIIYEADTDEVPSSAEMNTVRAMLQERLDALGYTKATLYTTGDRHITVEIPNLTNADETTRMLGSTSQLEFRDYTGRVWLTGYAVEKAKSAYGPLSDDGSKMHYAELTFKPEFRDTWTEVTKFAANQEDGENYVAIYMDNERVFAPQVHRHYASTGLVGESCVVSFGDNDDAAEAGRFADFIQIGGLPFALKIVSIKQG